MKRVLATLVVSLLYPAAGHTAITGSKHDLSGNGWGTNEICVFCHTPHNANKLVPNSPLWNHEVTAATFVVYSSASLIETPQQPRGPSKLCLSCHDGTVALDSFGTHTGAHFASGLANLGTDLSNDHPVSVYWRHQTLNSGGSTPCTNCHSFHGPPPVNLPFYNRYVECSTCHEPHANAPEVKMLRRTLTSSAICLHCHSK